MLLSMEVEQILKDRFGKDSLISLATSADAIPFVRTVDSFYQDGSDPCAFRKDSASCLRGLVYRPWNWLQSWLHRKA